MGRACSTSREKRNIYMILARKAKERKPIARPRRTWVDNIKMGLR
jgi:hypothetical protein